MSFMAESFGFRHPFCPYHQSDRTPNYGQQNPIKGVVSNNNFACVSLWD
jgi:hypothetical protein